MNEKVFKTMGAQIQRYFCLNIYSIRGKMKESKGFSLFPEKQFHIVFNGIDSGDAEVFNEKSCNIRA